LPEWKENNANLGLTNHFSFGYITSHSGIVMHMKGILAVVVVLLISPQVCREQEACVTA